MDEMLRVVSMQFNREMAERRFSSVILSKLDCFAKIEINPVGIDLFELDKIWDSLWDGFDVEEKRMVEVRLVEDKIIEFKIVIDDSLDKEFDLALCAMC